MSYSFSITADTKDEAVQKVTAELATVVANQPVHEVDRQAALAAADALINFLADPREGECVYVSVSGSLGWREEGVFTGANVSVGASVQTKI